MPLLFSNSLTMADQHFGAMPSTRADRSSEMQSARSIPRVLLIDDDPTFGKMMERAAKANSIPMAYCKSIDDFSRMNHWDYDVVIMDYDLGAVTGYELTNYLEKFTEEEIPVVLVSQTKNLDRKQWPETIRKFVHKGEGPRHILEATFEAYEAKRFHKRVAQTR